MSKVSKIDLEKRLELLEKENQELKRRLAAVEVQTSIIKPAPPAPAPNGSLSAKVRRSYEQNKKRYQAQLRQTLATDDGYLPIQSAGRPGLWYDPNDEMPSRTLTIEELKRAVASYLTGEADVKKKLDRLRALQGHYHGNLETRVDNAHSIARLETELAVLTECTEDLVSTTQLRLHPRFTDPDWEHKQRYSRTNSI